MDEQDIVQAQQGKVMGVIIPPPDIRAVADKTAQFVGRNGKSFEQRILNSNEGKTSKFSFLQPSNLYHAYYEMKIREAEEGLTAPKPQPSVPMEEESHEEKQSESAPVASTPAPAPTTAPRTTVSASTASIANPIAVLAKSTPAEPPIELEFPIAHPQGISALDLDVIKLTAQFTAANGRDFLATIAQQEQRNPQFDFLKPTHVLFSYFTTLVDSYAKVLQPSNANQMRLIQQRTDPKLVLTAGVHRWQWGKLEEERKSREESEADAERLAFQAIDWFDFTVVEVIEFGLDELMDVPGIAPLEHQLTNKVHQQPNNANQTLVSHAAVPSAPVAPSVPPPAPIPPFTSVPPPTRPAVVRPPHSSQAMELQEEDDDDDDLNVVTDYRPRIQTGTGGKDMMMVDPISGQTIRASDMEEHMRVQLLDPKWRQEKHRFLEKQKDTGLAAGESIADSLKVFARKRGDIFGQAAAGESSQSANTIAQQEEMEQRKNFEASQVQWDGHHSSIPLAQKLKSDFLVTTPAPAPAGNPEKPSVGPTSIPPPPATNTVTPIQVPPISLTMPLPMPVPPMPIPAMPMPAMAPPMMPFVPGMPPVPPPMAPMWNPAIPAPPVPELVPQSKKQKVTAGLVPADEFAERYPGDITVLIQLPSEQTVSPGPWTVRDGAAEGKALEVVLSVTTSIKTLKGLLSEQLGGLPGSKQQLKHQELGFLKDAHTLAEANVGDGGSLEFSVKSRGGKR